MRGRWRNLENTQVEKALVSRACHPKNVSISALSWVALGFAVVVLGGSAAADAGVSIPLPELSDKMDSQNQSI